MRKVVIAAGMLCTFGTSYSITSGLRKDINSVKDAVSERREYAAAIDSSNGPDGIRFATAGFLSQTLVVNVDTDPVDQDAILCDLLHGDSVDVRNIRTIAHMLGFNKLRVGDRTVTFDFSEHINSSAAGENNDA